MKVRKWIDKFKLAHKRSHLGVRVTLPGRKPVSKFFKTVAAREDWLLDFQKKLLAGEFAVTEEGKVESRLFSWCIEKFIAWGKKLEWTPKTLKERRRTLEQFCLHLGDPPIHTVERHHVVAFIENPQWANATRAGVCGALTQFFNYCGNADAGRDWVPMNKFMRLSWAKRREDSNPPGILTPEDAAALMTETPDKYKAGMALCLFTGLRPEAELPYLTWADINFSRKRIRVTVTKTRQGRVLADLHPNLWEWLKKYRGEPEERIIHSYSGFTQSRARANVRAFIEYPNDGARHSFASYGYWNGEEWARRTMGHTGTTDTFRKHYVNDGPTKGEAKKYFSITPPKEKSKSA
ncbi:MAG: hypothetical protein EBY38_08325 [Flavobacteriaceae bacterium]|nr:hypothetical protein [Flavobacteriaceae bacterium]